MMLGNVYLGFLNNESVYFLVYQQVESEFYSDLYEVLKLSKTIEFASDKDMLVKINDETFMIETWNYFYLTENEIRSCLYCGKIKDDEFDILREYRENGKTLPFDKRGLVLITDKNTVQKFKERETAAVRPYAMRALVDLLFD